VLRTRDAVLIHDIGPLTNPELFDPVVGQVYRHIYEAIAETGPHLIFVSQHSSQEFDRLFPLSRASTRRIIHPPIRPALYNVRQKKPDVDLPERYLLTVGSIGRRKNQRHSIAGYARSGLADQGVGYVICGGTEPDFEEVEAIARQTPGVVLMPYVPDEVLAWLYANAAGFVLMSVLEGFGMPVSEAVRCGLVPLVSRDSALTEITGDAAFWADPMDADDIAGQMQALIHLTHGERLDRMRRLNQAIERFDLMRFRQGWRAAMADIVTFA
jgi:glycosyltransferase involved in cell wall biosynthesis